MNYELLSNIADRWLSMGFVNDDKLSVFMDLEAVNEIVELDLEALFKANAFNFAHDMGGIYKHFNRQTKQLEDGFTPRHAKQKKIVPFETRESAGGAWNNIIKGEPQ